MLDYIKTMLLVAVFYIMYIKISYCGWKWLKRYLVLSEAVILAFLLRTFGIGLEDFIEWVIYQICFLIFVILKYKKDKDKRYELYDILGRSDFKITLFTNTKFIREEGYKNLINLLSKVLLCPLEKSNNSVVISIDQNKIVLNYLFKNQNDYIHFKEHLEELHIQIQEEQIKQYYRSLCVAEPYLPI